MRILRLAIVFLFCASGVSAQGLNFPKDSFPNLQRVLNLSDSQWGDVSRLQSTHQQFLGEKSRRLGQVNRELDEERLRPQPDPMALGVRYFEIAAICQASTSSYTTYKVGLRKLLNPQQQSQLTQMETYKNQLPAIGEAQSLSLLGYEVKDALTPPFASDPPSRDWRVTQLYGTSITLPGCPSNSNVNSFVIGGILDPIAQGRYPNLSRYLDLSPNQLQQIDAINNQFQQSLYDYSSEVETARQELLAEQSRPTPDARLLGEKAALIEEICRKSISLEAEAQSSVPSVLNNSQRVLWQDLNRAVELLPALSEAQQVNLSTRSAANSLPPSFLSRSIIRRLEWTASVSSQTSLPGCQLSPSGSYGWANVFIFDPTVRRTPQ